jgi:hypothetical protein
MTKGGKLTSKGILQFTTLKAGLEEPIIVMAFYHRDLRHVRATPALLEYSLANDRWFSFPSHSFFYRHLLEDPRWQE